MLAGNPLSTSGHYILCHVKTPEAFRTYLLANIEKEHWIQKRIIGYRKRTSDIEKDHRIQKKNIGYRKGSSDIEKDHRIQKGNKIVATIRLPETSKYKIQTTSLYTGRNPFTKLPPPPYPQQKKSLSCVYPLKTRRKLNIHKTFRRSPILFLNVLCTFNLCSVPGGMNSEMNFACHY